MADSLTNPDPWEGMIEHIPVAIIVSHFPSDDPADGYFCAVNPAAKEVLGYDLTPFLGVSRLGLALDERFDKQPIAAGVQMNYEVVSSGQPKVVENFVVESGLGRGTYRSTIFPLPGRRAASVFQRTDGDVAGSEAFGWAMRALEDSNRSLATFAATVAHDLKNPLAGIAGNAELAKMTAPDLPKEAAKALDRVIELASASASLIEGLLGFAEAPSANSSEVVDVRGVVEWSLSLLADQVAAAGVDIAVVGDGRVLGNEAALRQVLLNLVSNCIRYRHRERSLKIVITVDTAGQATTIVVADNGIGIDSSMHETIFEWGARADSSLGAPGGTGLGLAAARSALAILGGSIKVESSSEDGSVIRLALPTA